MPQMQKKKMVQNPFPQEHSQYVIDSYVFFKKRIQMDKNYYDNKWDNFKHLELSGTRLHLWGTQWRSDSLHWQSESQVGQPLDYGRWSICCY